METVHACNSDDQRGCDEERVAARRTCESQGEATSMADSPGAGKFQSPESTASRHNWGLQRPSPIGSKCRRCTGDGRRGESFIMGTPGPELRTLSVRWEDGAQDSP